MMRRARPGTVDPVADRRVAGYFAVPAHASDADTEAEAAQWRRALGAYAAGHGLHLTAVFADVRGRSESGVYRLMAHLRTGKAVAVVVPALTHLTRSTCLTGADLPTVQRFLRAQVLTIAAGAPEPTAGRPTPQDRSPSLHWSPDSR
jgi:hypothetical protein